MLGTEISQRIKIISLRGKKPHKSQTNKKAVVKIRARAKCPMVCNLKEGLETLKGI